MTIYEMLCDEYSVEWGLWLTAESVSPSTTTADIAIADEIADLQEQRDALRSGLDEVRTIVDVAKSEHPRLCHLLIGDLTEQIRELVKLAIANCEADEWLRRAETAEASAAQLLAGQQRLVAAARIAGYEYKVNVEQGVHFERVEAH